MVYQVEKMLKEHRDKISDDDAKAVEDALEETKKAMAEGGVERHQQGHRSSRPPATSWPRRCTKPPASRAAPPARRPGRQVATAHGAGEAKPKDDVVDAEFVDVDDKK